MVELVKIHRFRDLISLSINGAVLYLTPDEAGEICDAFSLLAYLIRTEEYQKGASQTMTIELPREVHSPARNYTY